jgi:3-hydroxyisobutyrate dehydrogenase
MKRIGFIGLGTMGIPMSSHLIRAGYKVGGVDIAATARDRFSTAGGEVFDSITSLVQSSDYVFTMLPKAEHVLEAYEGKQGILASARAHQVLIDCSTIGVDPARRIHAITQQRGLKFLDAPVSGAVPAAEAGTLVFMVGGDEATKEELEPVFLRMGSRVVYAGIGGNGQAIKVCNNMAAGIIKIAICEAFLLSERLGIDPKTFFEAASQGSAQSFALNVLCPVPGVLPDAPSSRGYTNGFPTSLMLKDLTLACAAGNATGTPLTIANAAAGMFKECTDNGYGDLDNAVIYQHLRSLAEANAPASSSGKTTAEFE